ncbi:MAG: NAD(P)/FAD-dependent oxidoreductase [Bacteroidota bacterium]|nr:NAD(P)/FAD-dependent oxidoreductase [Bacteroidota bacterium]
MDTKKILIAGAGISGLIAARLLLRAGLNVGIIEARDRTGGRIFSIYRHGVTVEAGPEFIHGRLGETMSLLEEYHIPYIKTAGKMYYARAGKFTTNTGNANHWNDLIDKMKQVKSDIPFNRFLSENFDAEVYRELRESAKRYAAGFDLADVNTVSTCSLIREWEQEDSEQYRIPEGYGKLTERLTAEFLSSGGEIFLNQAIRHIQWARNSVCITTTTSRKFTATKLLIALPAGVLSLEERAGNAVQFAPKITAKRKALKEIGFGAVIKIILYWNTPFWKEFVSDLQFIFSDKEIPTWWTHNPEDTRVLVGWIGGPPADDLSGLSEQEMLQIALRNLSSLFGITVSELNEKLLDSEIFNWRKDNFTHGAYSFELAGCRQAKAILKTSVEQTLYFAGEACYDGPHGGTVEAAIVSGMETAREIMDHVNNGKS